MRHYYWETEYMGIIYDKLNLINQTGKETKKFKIKNKNIKGEY